MARRTEARGDLARAIELYSEAGMPSEAARVMILRGDSEPEPKKRLPHYTQAAGTAPEGDAQRVRAVKKRAELVLALTGEHSVSAASRHDLIQAARDLEAIGDQETAAAIYARAGDRESEARALAQAGDVERLELLLTEQQTADREERKRHGAYAEIDLLVASGRRRDALVAAEAAGLRERAEQLRAQRPMGPIARLVVNGVAVSLVLGAEIVIGRTEGAIQIPSNAISRRHLAVARVGDAIHVRDLASRNGSIVRGLAIGGSVPIGDGLDLRLGKEVPVRVAPSTEMPGAASIEIGGTRYVAPLGLARLPIGAWQIVEAGDGWLELVTGDAPPAMMDGVQLVARTTLLVGDAIAEERGGAAVLRVAG